jgi:hypothetical protein
MEYKTILQFNSVAKLFHFLIVFGLRFVASIITFKLCWIADRIWNSSTEDI